MGETVGYKTAYEHFGKSFYAIWGNDPEIMAQAQAVNDEYNEYLYLFDVQDPWLLHPEIRDHLNKFSRIELSIGGNDE